MVVPRTLTSLLAATATGLALASAPAAAQTPGPAAFTNACGEQGFDPSARDPQPAPTDPPVVDVPLPYPRLVPVPLPDPVPDQTRVPQDPLPADPCTDPCPDLTDPVDQTPPPDAGPSPGSGSGSGSFSLPRIEIQPRSETIPIPIPGDDPGPEPQPAPPLDVGTIEPGPPTAPIGAPHVRNVELVSQVTGPGSENRTDKRWQVNGTDLGITWESSPGEVSVVFGDTFGLDWAPPGANGQDWRSNVLGHSTDTDLADGLTIDSMVQDRRCHAAEIIASRHIPNWETTTIPTSGFAIGDRQYLSYMSVRRWSVVPGMWYTNYGGIAYSDDGGRTWTEDQHAKWDNIFGIGRFQVTAMVPQGDHVYMFGTPNGRMGAVGLARVPVDKLLNPSAYQYWVSGSWVPVIEHLATPLVAGAASELSVRYDATEKHWLMSYLDPAAGRIVLRRSASPQGVWSDGATLADAAEYPGLYGGFMHPWSTPDALYFTMSEWDSYNVYLMRAEVG